MSTSFLVLIGIVVIFVGHFIIKAIFKKKDDIISVAPDSNLETGQSFVGDEDTYIIINTRGKRYRMLKIDNSYNGRHKSHWAYFDENGLELIDLLLWDMLFNIAEEGDFNDVITSDWSEDEVIYTEGSPTIEQDIPAEFNQTAHVDFTPEPEPVYEAPEPVYIPDPSPVYESALDTSDSYSRSSSSSYESSDSSSSYDSGSSDSGGSDD